MRATRQDLTRHLLHTVYRRGDVVIREAGPWTPTTHLLLRHLEQVGFPYSPRVVGSGFDDQGRETLATVQEALSKEIERLEEGALGADAAILAQTFRSVKAIIDRQVDLLDTRRPGKTRSSRRARKVKVE